MRGSRTHGYGQVGQHRHSGKQGGHGQAGLHKHKWSWTVKFDPDHFGRDQFKPPHQTKPTRWINVGDLDALASGMVGEKGGVDPAGRGFVAVLWSGDVGGLYLVWVVFSRKRAPAKIKADGSKVL